MSKMKSKKWFSYAILTGIMFFSSLMTNAFAWSNGHSSGNFNPNNPEELVSWKKTHYGTHDWIAEAALEAVLADNSAYSWYDTNGLPFWDNRRKIIFLVGTEAPDLRDKPNENGYISTTLDGKQVGGDHTSSKHKVWFNPDNNPRTEDSMREKNGMWLFDLIKTYTTNVRNALKNRKCDLAAFYMGHVVHVISDITNWAQVSDVRTIWDKWSDYSTEKRPFLSTLYSRLKGIHGSFERDVHYYTKEWNKRDEYFKYPIIGKDGYNNVGNINNPETLALTLAFETRFDTQITLVEYSAPTIPLHIQEMTYNSIWMYHHYSGRTKWGQNQQFVNRIQNELNRAVKASAKVLNYFGFIWNTETERICDECGTDEQPENSISIARALMMGIGVIIFIGIAASLSVPIFNIAVLKESFEIYPTITN
jgi:hypothetical protein